jgi:hypothetical protein
MNDVALEDSCLGLYHFVFEEAPNAILVLDADGRLILSNAAARTLPGELLHRLLADHEPHAVELDRFLEQLRALGRARTETRLLEGRTMALKGR